MKKYYHFEKKNKVIIISMYRKSKLKTVQALKKKHFRNLQVYHLTMCSNANLYNTFARKSSLNGNLAKQTCERLPRNGNRTTPFSKVLLICVLVLLCLLPTFTQREGAISPKQLKNNARSLAMQRMGRDPWRGGSSSVLDDAEFQMIIEKWADFENKMKQTWQYIEYYEYDAWFKLLFGTWLTGFLLMNNSSNMANIFYTWLDMSQKMGTKRIQKNIEDNDVLDKVIKKLKHKAFNKLIRNWDVEVEDFWNDIVRMKMEKNMEWCNFLREKCNAWISSHFM
ncbi:hypothetical protein AK88_04700 [Plasmodium fragile]|uniref:Plasmodium RESA N-terminal domain-containing protein n=1 Tax=Plasmodium fragile TaxID=5857 RepID=A0A0D9QFA2_PLAFR|nr:uncharacterized protein AK88_04700 [Plasmodium fragile]KJP85669.1 hypothetical protein AK88_04700 [Plasmodium fragile]